MSRLSGRSALVWSIDRTPRWRVRAGAPRERIGPEMTELGEHQKTSRAAWGAGGQLLPAFEILAEIGAAARRSASTPHAPPVECWALALPVLRRWARRYLQRRFRWSSSGAARATHEALVDDALQHLVEAVLQGKYASSASNLPAFIAWCQRVLSNFAVSEFRRAVRVAPHLHRQEEPDPWLGLETRATMLRLTARLRRQIACSARTRDREPRLALFDEFVEQVLAAESAAKDASSQARRHQRVCRGRRLACRAWAELCQLDAASVELREVAAALGLVDATAP